MPVNIDAAVGRLGEWQFAQLMLVNSDCPFWADADSGAGVGGAERRMKIVKLLTSDPVWTAVPVVPPLTVKLVESSGVGLNTQPGTADRSFGNPSFETPCSTL